MGGCGAKAWRIWVDTGGTFTDCLAVDPAGVMHRAKVLSTGELRGRVVEQLGSGRLRIAQNWGAVDDLVRGWECRAEGGQAAEVAGFDATQSVLALEHDLPAMIAGRSFAIHSGLEAPVLAARMVTGTKPGDPLPPLTMRLGTTRATNALLERRGAPTALFITRGFGDLLRIGDQQRPDLFALTVRRPPPLEDIAIEVDERLAADGSMLRPLDLAAAEQDARRALERGIRVAAVVLMHSNRNAAHERRLRELLLKLGFDHVTCSSDLVSVMRLVPRAQTAVVNAYLAPVVESYLASVRTALGGAKLHVATSAGGLVDSQAIHPRDMVLSGPAGGVAGAGAAGRLAGFSRVIGFDMGGTSTDVARYDGDFEYLYEHQVAGVRLVAPVLAIETVAAGGGSICECIDGRLRVGPRSAGADPGPACYGAGGPLTLTDVNLLLGRIDPGRFEIPVFREPAEAALERVMDAVRDAGTDAKPQAVTEGFLEIANERMAQAIAQVSVKRGFDPVDYAMVAFGGAGGQHACAVAARLGMRTIILPADASLLSALGLGSIAIERFRQRQVLQLLDQCQTELSSWFGALGEEAISEVVTEGVTRGDVVVRRLTAHLRLHGQDDTLAIAADQPERLTERFIAEYRAIYGHEPALSSGRAIEVESISVVAAATAEDGAKPQAASVTQQRLDQSAKPQAPGAARMWVDRQWREVPALEREAMNAGQSIDGPALVLDRRTTLVVERGWRAMMEEHGSMIVRQSVGHEPRVSTARTPVDAARVLVLQELFAHRCMSIAQEMGRMLQRTALSTNVKERLDYSCALLDPRGELLAHAPHMPVHLGSMGLCVRAVRQAIQMRPGDVVVTNHPAHGGSHLPDITVITPVHVEAEAQAAGEIGAPVLIGYVASRAHHAEIGGSRPGSMPPDARTLAQEGVVIPPMRLIEAGRARYDQLRAILSGGPWPSRSIADNLADVQAQVAANVRGADAIRKLVHEHGIDAVLDQMRRLMALGEEAARRALGRIPPGVHRALEHLDDGSPLQVAIHRTEDGRCVIDLTGSAPQQPGNFNATPAIVHSAVIYVLRLLVGASLPLNEGLMRIVDVVIPPGMLNPTFHAEHARCPAVAGGNTETSQRLVDTLLKALGLAGCSQGTMNNTLWGTERFAYYETVCGGSGATAEADGADAVHTHMTNTRITDPEVLEHRYPVRLDRFAIRRGTGGTGGPKGHRGGDGAVREVTFLAPMELSILSQHRRQGPYGMRGGAVGLPGQQRIIRADGAVIDLRGVDSCDVRPGDRLVIETPGGGGFGNEGLAIGG